MNIDLAIGPLVALIAGILILIVPRLLNFIVAIYLIIIGLLGLLRRPPQPALALSAASARSARRAQVAPLAERQVAEHDAADAHPLQAEHLQADRLAHAADLALPALAQHEAQLVVVEPLDRRPAAAPRRRARGRGAAARASSAGSARRPLGAARPRTRYSFSIVAVLADQLPRDAAVLGQHQQADRVDVEPAGRRPGCAGARGRKRDARAVLAPLRFSGVTSTRAGS